MVRHWRPSVAATRERPSTLLQLKPTAARKRSYLQQKVRLRFSEVSQTLIGNFMDANFVDDIIHRLNNKSFEIGDDAAESLRSEKGATAIIHAVLGSRVNTAMGKIRATTILHSLGARLTESEEVYLRLLSDRSAEVIDNALFGLVFLQNQENIPHIERAMCSAEETGKSTKLYSKAIRALKERDPFIYSPNFHDLSDAWRLDRDRFSDRIGPLIKG